MNEYNAPWTFAIDKYDNKPNGWIKGADGTYIVEYAGCGSHEAEWTNQKYVNLVSAAPDLLSALEDLLVEATILIGQYENPSEKGCVIKALAAIEKAYGRLEV